MSIIKVKRSTGTGQPSVSALKQGELAYSFKDDNANGGNTLYVGTTDGVDSIAIPVGGKKFTDILSAPAGTPTENKALIATTAGALGSLVLGDGTTNATLTSTTLVLTAAGLTFSGGNIVSNGTATITGLPSPDVGSPDSQVATKGYVNTVASGFNVSDSEATPNTGIISGNDIFTFAGNQGVTVVYDDATSKITVGLQQQLNVDDDVAFGSVTVGSIGGTDKIFLGDDNGVSVVKQVTPAIYKQFVSLNGGTGNVLTRSISTGMEFNIAAHGFENNTVVTYEPGSANQPISGLTARTYFIVNATTGTFQLSLTEGGNPINNDSGSQNGGGSMTDVLYSTNPVNLFSTSDSVTIGSTVNSTVDIGDNLTVGGNTVIAGNLTVSGETTTVNTSVMQVDDPVLELGEGAVADAFDRGIKFHYHDGTTADKTGFMGYDKSAGNFALLLDTSEATSQAFTGTTGTLVANLTGNVTGNATTTTGFDSSVLTQSDIDGLGGTAAVAGRQITLNGAVSSGVYATPGDTNSVFTAGPITWDGTGNLEIPTKLTLTVGSLLGNYVESVNTIAQDDTNPAGSSIQIGSLNNNTNGQQVTVDVRSATVQTVPPETDPTAVDDLGNSTHTDSWKDTQGVASFNSSQFSVDSGWVSIHTIDGGTYGTP